MDLILTEQINRLDEQKKKSTYGQYIATVLHEIVIGETPEESEKLYRWSKDLYRTGLIDITMKESAYLYNLVSRMKIPVGIKTPVLQKIEDLWQ